MMESSSGEEGPDHLNDYLRFYDKMEHGASYGCNRTHYVNADKHRARYMQYKE